MSRVLITGINGFIGSQLAEELIEKGYDVYGLVKYVVGRDIKPIQKMLDNIVIVNGDISHYTSISKILKELMPDYVIHLAALSPVRLSFELPFEYQYSNYIGTMNIAHSLLNLPDHESRRLVVASTAEVYGIQPDGTPFTEDMPLRPSSPYSVSKAAMDMYIRMMMTCYNLNATVMRCTNTYGRRFDKGFVAEYIITEMLKGNKVYIGAPNSIRDYMYVTDHTSAYIEAMENKKGKGEVFNAGTGIGTSNKELAFMIADKLGFDRKNVILGSYPPGYPHRPLVSDQTYLVLDASKIHDIIGWKAKVNLNDGLDKVIDFWKEKTR
jgi:nucleoside-diphosphate-sugar epimerase